MNIQIDAPWWLLLPLLLLPFWRRTPGTSPLPGDWSRLLAAPMHGYLGRFSIGDGSRPRRGLWLLLLSAFGAALASVHVGDGGQPPQRDLHARILVVDLGDASAARRAVFRAREFAQHAPTAPTAIIVSSGDAYDVVPITADPAPLSRYLDVLDPGLMPEQGHAPQSGLRRALAMFDRAGTIARQIVLFGGQAPTGPADALVPGQDVLIIVPGDADNADAWQRWAPRARVLPDATPDSLDRHLTTLTEQAQRSILGGGFDLTPFFIVAALLLWLELFWRRSA